MTKVFNWTILYKSDTKLIFVRAEDLGFMEMTGKGNTKLKIPSFAVPIQAQ